MSTSQALDSMCETLFEKKAFAGVTKWKVWIIQMGLKSEARAL
jgi:hypothetical protein